MPDQPAPNDIIATLEAPGLAEFERLADVAWRALPAQFRTACGDVVIRIEDFASDEILESLGIHDPYELTGTYHGAGFAAQSADDPAPAFVMLYRRPILDEWSEGGISLGRLVAHVLVHEIGHHFGLSDEEMAQIEAAGEPDADDEPCP